MNQDELFFAFANLIVSLFTLLIAIVAGIFAYIQWRKANTIRRAKFIYQLIEKLRNDKELVDTFQEVIYGQAWHGQILCNSKMEYQVDRLFAYLSYVCFLYRTKLILDDEFNIVKHKVIKVCENYSSQIYLWNLFHYWNEKKTSCSFLELINFGRENGWINSNSFNDKNSVDYEKIIKNV